MKCEHKWVRSGHGNDLICTKCGYAAAQAINTMPATEPVANVNSREGVNISININPGAETAEELSKRIAKELHKSIRLGF